MVMGMQGGSLQGVVRGLKALKPLAAFGCSENDCKVSETFAGHL